MTLQTISGYTDNTRWVDYWSQGLFSSWVFEAHSPDILWAPQSLIFSHVDAHPLFCEVHSYMRSWTWMQNKWLEAALVSLLAAVVRYLIRNKLKVKRFCLFHGLNAQLTVVGLDGYSVVFGCDSRAWSSVLLTSLQIRKQRLEGIQGHLINLKACLVTCFLQQGSDF